MIKINTLFPFKLYFYGSIDSTNNECKRLALKGIEEALVIANSQYAGKGRLSRSFFSPKNSGLYMSLLLRPTFSADKSAAVTTAAAVAVSLAIDEISGKNSMIKWVNDIYVENRKICGILAESGFSQNNSALNYIILGIGINLCKPEDDFPEDIKDKAGYLFDKKSLSKEEKLDIAKLIIDRFLKIYNDIENKDYMNIYRQKSLLYGKKVSFEKNGQRFCGIVEYINDNAEIIINANGEKFFLFAGEVSLEF
ncbi:MAG: biotin--[acetyl-CoA-carboxylase] ligase [Ruminococcaceae bacterium]|nr:biotin--[acetyl-CoA-carboxylase] ligase [Oscillospiraceae bacterium]